MASMSAPPTHPVTGTRAARPLAWAARAADILQLWLSPFLLLAIRLWIARVFFSSGLVKISDWDATLFLFQTSYKVPILPPEIAAPLAAAFELSMPVLLILGLFTRLAALPLLGMSLVIQFALGAADPAYNNIEHFYWMFLLLTIFVFGPGKISLDHLIMRRFRPA
jgi:putative oxidoreductase